MKIKIFILGLLISPLLSLAQYEECGTEMTSEDLQIIQTALQKSISNKDRTPADSIVPIKFHIIRTTNGTGGIDSVAVYNELAKLNAEYINAGIKFMHCDYINYINNTAFMNFEKVVSETICDVNDLPNVINVYFANNVFKITNGNTSQLCGYAYTSSLTKNRVVMDNDCATNGSTLLHELGHYFSLAHTHSTSGGGELVDGSNCTTAGDKLCDTPADPGLSTLVVNSACQYTGTFTDANNQAYTPNVRNIMSYSRKSCRDYFSPGQFQRMQAYFQSYRNYLSCAPVSSNDIKNHISLDIYPNPTKGFLNISSSEKLELIKLFDQTGRLVYKNEIEKQQAQLDINFLSPGIYFYSLKSGQTILKGKLQKN